jgi:hypothetical protein
VPVPNVASLPATPNRGITPGPRYPVEWDSPATAEAAEQVHSEHALS